MFDLFWYMLFNYENNITQQQIKLVTKQLTFAVRSMVYYIYIKELPEGLLATLRATCFDISL